jgi:DNA-directed RNA polymerase specialized sigma24 family protein
MADDQYRSMVRLAVLLVRDDAAAEEVVQDCLAATGIQLPADGETLAHLRRCVVNRSGSLLRHRQAARRAPGT